MNLIFPNLLGCHPNVDRRWKLYWNLMALDLGPTHSARTWRQLIFSEALSEHGPFLSFERKGLIKP
jgi:hypothetical protein